MLEMKRCSLKPVDCCRKEESCSECCRRSVVIGLPRISNSVGQALCYCEKTMKCFQDDLNVYTYIYNMLDNWSCYCLLGVEAKTCCECAKVLWKGRGGCREGGRFAGNKISLDNDLNI